MIKCVIWDLDNTVWNGILSESSSVELRAGVTEVLSELTKRGIISSISSRNNYEIAIEKLNEYKINHFFIYPQISWCNKSESIKKILDNLHLRPQNILFVDDNEFERDEVKSVFPEITIDDASNILNLLLLEGIEKQSESEEATKRVALYKLDEQRIKDNECFEGTNNEFLMSCNIQMKINIATELDIGRIGELIERTNQLNSTGVHYNKKQIIALLHNPIYQIYIATVWDKYGSYGRSGLVIARLDNRVYEISLFIVSCRLMGKGIAQSLLAYFAHYASDNQYRHLRLLFKRNKFNRQMILLYTMNGFEKIKQYDEIDIYEIDLERKEIELPQWIKICEKSEKTL
jgi:FkbH-like protein